MICAGDDVDMNTNELITTLAAQPAPHPLRSDRLGTVLLAVMALCAGLFLVVFGAREDLVGHLVQPLIAAKTLLPALVCLIALPVLLALLRPEGRIRYPLRFAVPLILAAALWGTGFAVQPAGTRFADASPFAVAECVGLILLIAAPALWVAIGLLRRGATTRPAVTGALAGLVVGAGAAAGYSFFCLQDNPLFYVTWYGVAVGLTVVAGAGLGALRLRW